MCRPQSPRSAASRGLHVIRTQSPHSRHWPPGHRFSRPIRSLNGVAAVAVSGVAKHALAAKETLEGGETSLKGTKLAMVIDQQRCTGCGGCTIACMNENNIQSGKAWAYMKTKTEGKFPNVKYTYKPTLCNHCVKAPCIRICPSGAMHKIDGNITMHDPKKCIGCKKCLKECPTNAIKGELKYVHIVDQSKCNKCGTCLDVCPKKVSAVIKVTGKEINTGDSCNHQGGVQGVLPRDSEDLPRSEDDPGRIGGRTGEFPAG